MFTFFIFCYNNIYFLFCVGVNIVDGAEESFFHRFSIDDDLHNKTATIELHFTSIDLLVSVRVDSVNCVTTTYSSSKVAINDVSTLG